MARKARRTGAAAFAMVSITIGVVGCTRPPGYGAVPGVGSHRSAQTTPTGGLSGDVRVIPRAGADTALGPVVVTAEPVSATSGSRSRPQRVRVTSSSDRFEPAFTALAEGDSVVFVNEGKLSHSLFSADLEEDVRIAVGPDSTSEPVVIEHRGEARFFCSLHPDESFGLVVTAPVPSSLTDHNGWYDIWPLEDGLYRLSIWTRRVSGPIRVVEVASGHLSIETIWIDPDLIGR